VARSWWRDSWALLVMTVTRHVLDKVRASALRYVPMPPPPKG